MDPLLWLEERVLRLGHSTSHRGPDKKHNSTVAGPLHFWILSSSPFTQYLRNRSKKILYGELLHFRILWRPTTWENSLRMNTTVLCVQLPNRMCGFCPRSRGDAITSSDDYTVYDRFLCTVTITGQYPFQTAKLIELLTCTYFIKS